MQYYKWFEYSVDYLWNNRKEITKQFEYFDYPDYAGIKKSISNRLYGDSVDVIQKHWKIWALI